jgi:LysM repeat protein
MRKSLSVILLILCFGVIKITAKPTDSLRVELRNGIKYIVHRVVKTENLAILAAKYHVSPSDIQSNNPLIVTDVKAGQIVLIPLNIDKYGDIEPAKITPSAGGNLPIASALPPPKKSNIPVIAQQEVSKLQEEVKLPDDLKERDKQSGKVLRKEIINTDTFIVFQVGMEASVPEVAKKFNVTDDAIKLYNNLTSIVLVKDQVIRILVSKQAASEATVLGKQAVEPEITKEVTEQRAIEKKPEEKTTIAENNLVDESYPYPYTYTKYNNQKAILYTTRDGDDLRNIANYFKTSVDQIKRINKLSSNKLPGGKSLTIVPSKNFVEPIVGDKQPIPDNTQKPRQNISAENINQATVSNNKSASKINESKKNDEEKPVAKKAEESKAPVTELHALNENPLIRVAMINSDMDYIDEDAKKADSWAINKLNENVIEVESTNQSAGVGDKNTTHVVKKGETLLSIARLYGIRTTDIINWNGITNYRVREGQDLIINQKRYEEDFYSRNSIEVNIPSEIKMVESIEETGLAYFDNKAKFVGVLHESLPVGKMIKITNRDNFLETYARVAGKLPKIYDENVIIQLDRKTAEKLRVNNPTIKVKLNYAILN